MNHLKGYIHHLAEHLSVAIAARKEAEKHETKIRGEIMSAMNEAGIKTEPTEFGNFTVCIRRTKVYGTKVKQLEAQLKAAKAEADHLGDYTIKEETEYLRVH